LVENRKIAGGAPTIRLREITDSDVGIVAELLGRGLGYSKQYYLKLLGIMRTKQIPAGFPKYGYVLEDNYAIVGAIILIYSTVNANGVETTRCHISSWYVEPKYRLYATLLSSKALKRKDVTFLNISARPRTRPIIQAEGFVKYSSGQFVATTLFQRDTGSAAIEVVPFGTNPKGSYQPHEYELLAAHHKYGCICIWCTSENRAFPFIFRATTIKGIFPSVQLIYSNDIADLVRFAHSIGAYLALRRIITVRIDANGPIHGLIGRYFDGIEARYFKGLTPRLGDLTFTQRAMTAPVRRNFLRRLVDRLGLFQRPGFLRDKES
jgi:hypothetical protein